MPTDDAHADRARRFVAELFDEEELEDLRNTPPHERSVRIDWQDLAAWELQQRDDDVDGQLTLDDVRGIASDVCARPQSVISDLETAFESVYEYAIANVDVHVHNLPGEASFVVGDFSPARQRERLLELEGQVTKRSEIHPSLRVAVYQCTGCGKDRRVEQPPFGKIREPRGPCWDCKGEKRAYWRRNDDMSEWADHQKLRLQQPPEEALGETKYIDAHVFGSLTGREEIESGSRIQLAGRLVDVFTGEVHFGKRVVGQAVTPDEEVFDDEDLAAYQEAIDEIRNDDNRFQNLVASLAPKHEGDPLVKEALLIAAFTGGRWQGPGGAQYRGDSHVQLIGDPGTNKSGLLKALYQRVPIGAYTDGPGSSGAGLTAALSKDEFSSEQWSIEAGTLVRASGGTAFIDELDEFERDELSALHTPLESQEVLVSKAGKRATLTSETSVVAAANPTGGHYDPTREFADQVDLKSPLLSRFDLIFVMREKVDEEKVRAVSTSMVEGRNQAGLNERGELDGGDADDQVAPYSADEMRAYIADASTITPVIRDEQVKQEIIDWYTRLKTDLPNRYREAVQSESSGGNYPNDAPPLPVTARKVDAMFRLAAASARIRYDDTIRMKDIERVRPYLKRSIADIGIAPSDNEAFDSVRRDVDPSEVGV